jgi:SAM-dependent methyltransferase
MESLREAWEANAASWIEWSRSPERDHAFWRMNLPTLLALVPAAGGPVLDVGCGEGRVSRALKELGYEVVGVDGSPTLAAAAREADPGFEVLLADAAALPFASESFELAVASLTLMNMDDMPGAVSEIARVLRPGGRLCASVLHPLNTWGKAGGDYFETTRYSETIEAGGASLTLHDTHRPLTAYFDALASAGMLIERVVEPVPDEAYLAAVRDAPRWRERPGFLHVRAGRTG